MNFVLIVKILNVENVLALTEIWIINVFANKI